MIGGMTRAATNTAVPGAARSDARRALPLLGRDCCASLIRGALGEAEAERLAKSFKALADPTRVRLLSLIAASEDGEACICDLTEVVRLSQPTVSHHMRQLVDAGLVTRQQRGKWAFYAIVTEALDRLSSSLTTTN
ncbi:MAG: metalloregulator ArsR/SmtB family transcription factor [Nostocoides sp.]